jgi:hypothetical protein
MYPGPSGYYLLDREFECQLWFSEPWRSAVWQVDASVSEEHKFPWSKQRVAPMCFCGEEGKKQNEDCLKKLNLTSWNLFYEQVSQTTRTWNESNGELYFYEYVCLSTNKKWN